MNSQIKEIATVCAVEAFEQGATYVSDPMTADVSYLVETLGRAVNSEEVAAFTTQYRQVLAANV